MHSFEIHCFLCIDLESMYFLQFKTHAHCYKFLWASLGNGTILYAPKDKKNGRS